LDKEFVYSSFQKKQGEIRRLLFNLGLNPGQAVETDRKRWKLIGCSMVRAEGIYGGLVKCINFHNKIERFPLAISPIMFFSS
jgi:hypothetical protein